MANNAGGKKNRGRFMNKRTVTLGVSQMVFLVAISLPTWAQEGRPSQPVSNASSALRGPVPSDLAAENLTRVGASPAQLQVVFLKDPGLLVELKRWIAKEAADYGQVVDDASLTDQAVFERLERDIAFRSVATRLVQKYGYLLPSVNPTSDMAKEQDLILKERAKHYVQTEEREEALQREEIERISKGESEGEDRHSQSANCDPASQDLVTEDFAKQDSRNQEIRIRNSCRELSGVRGGQRGLNRNAAPDSQPDYPDFQVPYIPYRNPRAQIQTARDEEDGSS